jgi:DNA polymerase I-like protein with 3'-5' exonuclease and polymerase domains
MPQHAAGLVPVYRTLKVDTSHRNIDKQLINTPELFDRMVRYWDKCGKGLVGFDTETTGLDTTQANLVGCSLSFSYGRAFYLPFGHENTEGSPNLSREILPKIATLLDSSERVLMWNKRFDLRVRRDMMGHDISVQNDFDPSILVFNWDTNIGMPALKKMAFEILGWDLKDFADTFGKNANLSHYTPEEVLDYACMDAVLLLHLYRASAHMLESAPFIINLDEQIMRIMLELEELPHPLDIKHLENLGPEILKDLKDTKAAIEKSLKKEINPGSSQQVGRALLELKIDTGAKTKTGRMATGEEYLTRIENRHPVIPMILRYRKLQKASGTYIQPLLKSSADNHPVRFAYKTTMVPTGRFAGGSKETNPFFTKVNIQAIIKPFSRNFLAIPNTGKKSVVGWKFLPIDRLDDGTLQVKGHTIGTEVNGKPVYDECVKSGYIVEGKEPTSNLRKAFKCHPDHLFCHFDYKAEEMRLPANFSKDPVMIDMFLSGKDPHTQTAYMMFGKENYNSDFRKKAKICNFNLLYGGQKYSIAEKLKCSPAKAQEYINRWWKVFGVLEQWRDGLITKGRRQGFIRTAYGRFRRVKYWTSSLSRGIRSFGDRTIVNTKVQGTGGDIMRIALVQLYNAGFLTSKECSFLSSVHDEVNFSIHRDRVVDTIPKIYHCMDIKRKSWMVPMEIDFELGFSWGELWPFHFDSTGILVPTGQWIGTETEKTKGK